MFIIINFELGVVKGGVRDLVDFFLFADFWVVVVFVGVFKALVAARIGREPHEIMLKRQGERPFKDQLTLEDYGVSNGVQLDL